ncbi:MAG TPA: hypothetical protein VGE74_10760 [Gemmata sp.]
MPNTPSVYGYLRQLTALAVLTAALPPTVRGDEPRSAEKDLKRVVAGLPKCAEQAGIPRRIFLAPPTGADKNLDRYGIVRTARLTSDTTAKITIRFYYVFENDRTEENFTLFLYLSWYKGTWTVTRSEGNVPTPDFGYGEPLRKFVANLDELGSNP